MKKNQLTSALVLVTSCFLFTHCSKSGDAVTSKCSVNFKGTAYSLDVVNCSTTGTNVGVFANSPNVAGQSLDITVGSVANEIIFLLDGSGPDALYQSSGTGINPTVTISGSTFTISATLANPSGDSGTLDGTCSCGK